MSEIYISTDIETDGPIPGPNSMLSLGAAAFDSTGNMIGTFQITFKPLPDSSPDPNTKLWWESQPKDVYEAARANPIEPRQAIQRYVNWIDSLGKHRPVFVGYPAGFDFLFVYWYLIKFLGKSPFSFSALDIKTFAMAMLKTDYRESTKRNMPKHWFKNAPKHTHKALDDAIGQGMLFANMLKENQEKELVLEHMQLKLPNPGKKIGDI